MFLNNCSCIKDDLPCIHHIYQRIINLEPSKSIINANDIPDIYYVHTLQEVKGCINEKRTIESQNENWEYNYLMNRLKVYVDLAQ